MGESALGSDQTVRYSIIANDVTRSVFRDHNARRVKLRTIAATIGRQTGSERARAAS